MGYKAEALMPVHGGWLAGSRQRHCEPAAPSMETNVERRGYFFSSTRGRQPRKLLAKKTIKVGRDSSCHPGKWETLFSRAESAGGHADPGRSDAANLVQASRGCEPFFDLTKSALNVILQVPRFSILTSCELSIALVKASLSMFSVAVQRMNMFGRLSI